MIYTITLAPSLDYLVTVDDFKSNYINRSHNELYLIGGKGINVSIVLKRLGIDSKLLGFLGGFSGEYIKNKLKELSLNDSFTPINATTRINVKISSSYNETAINASSAVIQKEEYLNFLSNLNLLKENDIVVVSGSVPKSIDIVMFEDMLKLISKAKSKLIIDTTGKYLEVALKYNPFLIKPNKEELEELLNVNITSNDQCIKYAKYLVDKGAKNVIVSLGSSGAILVNNDTTYKASALSGKFVSSVGAGDSLIAGFIYKYIETINLELSLDFACKVGSKTCFCNGLATALDLKEIL